MENKMSWKAAAQEFRTLINVGVVKGAVVKVADLEQLVEDQSKILSALSAEHGKNLYQLWKLQGEFSQ